MLIRPKYYKMPITFYYLLKRLILNEELVLLHNATNFSIPTCQQFESWIALVCQQLNQSFQISIEIVDCETSQYLNKTYRGKDKATNVLSFPLELPEVVDEKLLGDLAICAEIVESEALQQNKTSIDHWTHLTIHGVLHLLGYNHINNNDAEIMENLEIKLLAQLGIDNPYAN